MATECASPISGLRHGGTDPSCGPGSPCALAGDAAAAALLVATQPLQALDVATQAGMEAGSPPPATQVVAVAPLSAAPRGAPVPAAGATRPPAVKGLGSGVPPEGAAGGLPQRGQDLGKTPDAQRQTDQHSQPPPPLQPAAPAAGARAPAAQPQLGPGSIGCGWGGGGKPMAAAASVQPPWVETQVVLPPGSHGSGRNSGGGPTQAAASGQLRAAETQVLVPPPATEPPAFPRDGVSGAGPAPSGSGPSPGPTGRSSQRAAAPGSPVSAATPAASGRRRSPQSAPPSSACTGDTCGTPAPPAGMRGELLEAWHEVSAIHAGAGLDLGGGPRQTRCRGLACMPARGGEEGGGHPGAGHGRGTVQAAAA
jgi:hypothetical protein